MKTLKFILACLVFLGPQAYAEEDIVIKVESLTNGARSTVLEACGTAIHAHEVTPKI